MDTRNSDNYDHQTTTVDMTWFCPKHFCNSCGVLDKLSVPVHTMRLPSYLYLHHATPSFAATSSSSYSLKSSSSASSSSSSSVIEQKSLKCCNLCPTSFCADCEDLLLCQHIPTRLSSSPYFPLASNHAKSFFKTKKSTGVSLSHY